jgi:tetratricopeptide (TPR) repeat protein
LTYDGLGQHRRAIEAYGDAVRLSPDSAEAHYNLGVAYDKLRLYDEAVEAYGQGLVLNPDWAKARSNLGVAYTNKGLYDKAARQHRQAVRLAPDVAGMAYNLGVALDKKGSAEEAVRALELDPDFALPHLCLGVLFLEQKADTERAAFHLRRSLIIDPEQPQAEAMRTKLYELEGGGAVL